VSSDFDPDALPTYARIELRDLHRIAEWQDRIPWQPFSEGVQIHRLYGDGVTGATAALLRFLKSGTVHTHEHVGFEHILVLAGSQADQNGVSPAGSLVINPPGTRHRIVSEAGCIVLAIYEKPVVFLPE
jgi:anti-sigma factor ChrR (cupin superfamily)